ncbi:hypothetical protein SLS62_002246 [Diatrype stigma]|uniref:Metal tolerance protein 3 protein n=1 Tax=Diatrype stigma TaxID=117547 RepID=A0AAN9UXF6_9PEZI
MFRTPFTLLVLALSIFHVSIASTVADVDVANALPPALTPRQSAGGAAGAAADPAAASSPACQEYAIVANLSTVGLTPDYRAAWLRSSPLGTDAASSILDTQSPKLDAMKFDAALNAQCGNLTTVAAEGAATNFTQNIVLGLPIKEIFGADPAGFATPFVSVLIILVMGGTFMSL